jgi:phage I-like protein
MADQPLDVGAGAVHVPGGSAAKKVQPMAVIKTAQRDKLKASQFADPTNRKFPIQDKAHADNAMARLEQEKSSMSPGKYRSIKARIKAAQRSFGEKPKTGASGNPNSFRLRMSNSSGGYTLIHHQMSAVDQSGTAQKCSAAFDEQTGELSLYYVLDKAQALSAADADGRVWVQCACTGAWAGHAQGAFRITEQTLDVMVDNFHREGTRRQYDFNHASGMAPSSGNIPVVGTPAQAWFYDLQRRGDALFALTEWLPLAKQYLENDQYGGISPLIAWESKDRVSGRIIGPLIKSIALTNDPFLLGMRRPTAASAAGLQTTERGLMPLTEIPSASAAQALSYSYMSTASMLPMLKCALGLHELATAQHCCDALLNLSTHLDAVDGDATAKHEGIDLSSYVSKLRELVGDSAGMSCAELIQFIDKLLDEYMAENGIEDDDSGVGASLMSAATEPTAATAASTEGTDMADPVIEPAAVVASAEPATPAVVALPADPPPVAAEPATVTAASASAEPLPSPEVAALTLQVAELKAALARKEATTQELSAAAAVTTEQALSAEVDAAISTYKDTKGLSPELRPHLMSILKSTPDAFRASYPAVEPAQRHLLANLTGGGASNPAAPGARVEADAPQALDATPPVDEPRRILALGLNGLTDELISNSGGKLSLLAAQHEADALLRTARTNFTK